jgi:hypothetical protein
VQSEALTPLETPPAALELADLLALEREERRRAERASTQLARLVAKESRRAEDEREARLAAERVASDMAVLVAHEAARADAAEERLRRRGR